MDDFEDIRPFRDNEVPGVIGRLSQDREFLDFLGRYDSPRLAALMPPLVRGFAARRVLTLLGDVSSVRDFQLVVERYARKIITETMTEFSFDGIEALDPGKAYVFISNHRDIAGDSMLVDYALHVSGRDTVRIAVGDNLVQRQFATDLMKLNKSFFIKRTGEGAREKYAGLSKASKYVHQSIAEGESIWIAQREGRAKDGMDTTDPAVIKMLGLAERKKDFAEVVSSLNLVPVTLSYEFDPCDELKAKELSAVRRDGYYEKPPGEDLVSLARGLGGFKGRVHLAFGRPLTGHFEDADAVAAHLDIQIPAMLRLYPVNYLALAELAKRNEEPYASLKVEPGDEISSSDQQIFTERLAGVDPELQYDWLRMYANPVLNKSKSLAVGGSV